VYAAIDSERRYQDRVWTESGSAGNPNPLTIGEFLLLIEAYVAQARTDWSREPKPVREALHGLRKIAGIAVNAMEQHGAPVREDRPVNDRGTN